MPCHELFDQQSEDYKNKILQKLTLESIYRSIGNKLLEKYTGTNGLNFGIDDFGKSAPYKDIYKHFELNTENIVQKIKEKI